MDEAQQFWVSEKRVFLTVEGKLIAGRRLVSTQLRSIAFSQSILG